MAEEIDYCGACGLEIEDLQEIVIGGKTYHMKCNVCQMCHRSLTGMPVQFHEGKLYDQECFFANFAKICDICTKPIVGLNVKFLATGDKYFHPACYVCAGCHRSLQGVKYYMVRDKRMCVTCKSPTSSTSSATSISDEMHYRPKSSTSSATSYGEEL